MEYPDEFTCGVPPVPTEEFQGLVSRAVAPAECVSCLACCVDDARGCARVLHEFLQCLQESPGGVGWYVSSDFGDEMGHRVHVFFLDDAREVGHPVPDAGCLCRAGT